MRWALVAAIFVVACGGVFAAEEKETRQQKIDRLCKDGEWAEAESYVLAEVASRRRNGKRPLAESLLQLALVLNSQSKWEDALEATGRAKNVSDSLNDRAKSQDDLPFHISTQEGIALIGIGEIPKARDAFEEALLVAGTQTGQDGLGPDHDATAATLVHLANTYLAENKLKEARPHLQRAMVIFEERLGVDAPQTKEVREMLAKLNDKMRAAEVLAE